MRRFLLPLAAAALLTLLTAQLAQAAKPIHDKFLVDETFPENVCGVDVTTHVEVTGNVLIPADDPVMDLSLVRVTFTNPDGDWLELFAAGPGFITETLDGDILTIAVTGAGVQERLRSSEGITEAFDRGRISLVQIIDLNNLEDPEDDVFLGFEVITQAGPHPEADSGGALFCDVFNDVLG
ncbi:MAG: hypothetical protein ACRDGJ_02390 [Candidatus Limnocylindria bacterium]